MSSKPATFDDAPPPGTINFGVGQPSLDLLPVELMREASERYLRDAVSAELNYGPLQGDVRFRESLAALLGEEHGPGVEPDQLMLSGGNSQALDYICAQLIEPGDTVLVEAPTYFLAFSIFRDHGARLVSVPMDDHGIDVDALASILTLEKPKLLYTIPSFHNPTGRLLPAARRERLVELAASHDFLILADEVYQMLWYDTPPPPPLGHWADSGRVLSLGSFSKILAPGLRLGWVQASAALTKQLLGSGVLNSGGAFNHYTSHLVRHAIDGGLLQPHIVELREIYARRVAAMQSALETHLGDALEWECPAGGYFFWLRMKNGQPTRPLRARASEAETGFQPGDLFVPDGGFEDYLRLSFAHYRTAQIGEGIERLARVLLEAGE